MSRKNAHSVATSVNTPITLSDSLEHLPAPAWKAIPLSLPYGGTVSIDVQVIRGNRIDVLLTNPDQIDALKKWNGAA